jgi:hypothetical protein
LFLHRNVTDFCILILYPASLLHVFMNSNSFLVELLETFRYKIVSAAMDNLTSSFPIWTPCISFSCLIALARNSSTMLNKSGNRRHPCLVHDFRDGFTFSPLSMMLAIGLPYGLFYGLYNAEECAFYSSFLQSFYHEKMLNFFWMLFLHLLVRWYGFILDSVYVLNYIDSHAYVVPSLHPWNGTYLIMMYVLFNVLLASVSKYIIEDFYTYAHQGDWHITFFFDWSLPGLVLR